MPLKGTQNFSSGLSNNKNVVRDANLFWTISILKILDWAI